MADVAAPADSGKTTLLSPVDQKFYSVPTGQVSAYLKAGYATPIARDVAHERLLKQYSGWADTLTAGALGAVHGIPLADTTIESYLPPDLGEKYAQTSKIYEEANPFASGVGKIAGGLGGFVAGAEIPKALGLGEAAIAGGDAATTAVAAADTSRFSKAADFARGAVKSGAINAAVGAAGQLDEAALNHAIDPEGHEKLNMSMGGLLADFALGAGAHIGLSAIGKIFKGAGHGLDYVADSIRAKGIADTAPIPEGAPSELGPIGDPTVQTAAGPVDPGTNGPAAVPSLEDLGHKPISAAEQRIQDIKTAQAEAASAPIDPAANPSVRAQKAQSLQAELERLQSMSQDEIIAEHTDPTELASASVAPGGERINPLYGQEHEAEAFDRLENISNLTRAEQNKHLDGHNRQIMTRFRQAEFEQESKGRPLTRHETGAQYRELEAALGNKSAVLQEKIRPFLSDPVDQKLLTRLRSPNALDGLAKSPEARAGDLLELEQMQRNVPFSKTYLRNQLNMKRTLGKLIDFDSTVTTPENDALKEAYRIAQKWEAAHFKQIKPGEVTPEEFADLNKQYSINMLAKRAIGQTQGEEGTFAKIAAKSAQDHAAVIEKLQTQAKQADALVAQENERAARSKARSEDTQNKRLTDAERQKARQDYNEAVKNVKAQQAAAKKAASAIEAEKAKASQVQERAQRERERQLSRAEAKAAKLKDQNLKQQQINEAKFGNVVQSGILGAVTHGVKGSLGGMAASAAFAVLRGIPASKWAMVGDKLSVLFKGVDRKLATTVEAGLYGIPAEVHRALDPNDYPNLAAKVMAARNGPQNAYQNLAQAHLENDVPDALATPLTQQGWSALQAIGKAIPQTAGAPGVYSQEEPDAGQKLAWMGQLKTVEDPTYGIANPTPENLSLLKAYYPKMLYNSQQAAMLEVQQNPDLPLEGKLWASQLCERPLTALASSQFLGVLAGARQQSEQSQQQQNSPSAGKRGSQKVQSSMSRMDSLQNQDA